MIQYTEDELVAAIDRARKHEGPLPKEPETRKQVTRTTTVPVVVPADLDVQVLMQTPPLVPQPDGTVTREGGISIVLRANDLGMVLSPAMCERLLGPDRYAALLEDRARLVKFAKALTSGEEL